MFATSSLVHQASQQLLQAGDVVFAKHRISVVGNESQAYGNYGLFASNLTEFWDPLPGSHRLGR
ncbi:hypothetical protein [Aliiruegeria sabulilitoris]|uniref:hypothetical protein n=1 Tax=Aliiruegeria sabulilitoris TaxID=1510458 RepID=UPI0012E39709|nr:hypothetical protein [Aliiruegeria sabulilitoris]NDR55654.1 hypothetical protein [Pseudoruegeria sp. M32A2M]